MNKQVIFVCETCGHGATSMSDLCPHLKAKYDRHVQRKAAPQKANLTLFKFNDEIKKAVRKMKHLGHDDICFVMNRTAKIKLGDGFTNVPRFCVDPEGERYRGIRLFFDPLIPVERAGFFFPYDLLIERARQQGHA